MTALVAAVGHPIRAKCLTMLAEKVASPNEIAVEFGLDVTNVGYHVTNLADAGLIELVETRPVRGATEHFYRAVAPPVVTDDLEEERSLAERKAFAEITLSLYGANATRALEAGTLVDRGDHHLTRFALGVDRQGWEEATEAYLELFERIYEIQAQAAARMGESEEKPIPIISFLSLFEMPQRAERSG